MDFKKVFLAAAVLAALTACSEEENPLKDQPVGTEGEAYMSLAVEMPNLGYGTRALNEEGTSKHEGTLGEQQISNLEVIIYDDKGLNPEHHTFAAAQLKPQAPNPIAPNLTTVYTLPAFSVKAGMKKVVVIVNPLKDKFVDQTQNSVKITDLNNMQTEMVFTEADVKSISSDGNFMMTNANKDAQNTHNGAVAIEVKGTKQHPTVVTVEVERVVAKIEEKTANYTIPVTNSQDQVLFQEVALINGNTKFFPIKKIQANGNNDYVVDPNFSGQSENTRNDFYAKTFATGFPKVGEYCKTLTDNQASVFYTLENTMTAAEQKNAYTTGLYYKAQYQLNKQEGNVYAFGGQLYSFATLEQAAPNLGLNLSIPQAGTGTTPLTDASSAADFAQIGVVKYENGICYYPYWIRHVNSPETMAPMEFAVVRNNYYQMSIKTVKGIGQPTPEEPNVNTPDEDVNSYLDVQVKVLPWVVRVNGIEF